MKNLFTCLIVLLTTAFLVPNLSAQTNLVTNGDFEEWDFWTSQPKDWGRHISASVSKSDDAQSGDFSVEMESDDLSNYVAYVESSKISIKKGKTYNGTFYYKAISGTITKLQASLYYTKAGEFFPSDVFTKEINNLPISNEWSKFDFTYSEIESNKDVQIQILIWSDNDARILIDNVVIQDASLSSLSSIQQNELVIYPNPAQDYIILPKLSEIQSLSIYDLSGRLLKQISPSSKKINISNLSSGTYIVNIKCNEKTVKTKLIKK